MNIGFTGTRDGMTEAQKKSVKYLLETNRPECVIHGDCVGADADFDRIAASLNIDRYIFPSNINDLRAHCEKLGAKSIFENHVNEPMPPLIRNGSIVQNADLIIACPKETKEITRSGTWSTIRKARAVHAHVFIIYPDGFYVDK